MAEDLIRKGVRYVGTSAGSYGNYMYTYSNKNCITLKKPSNRTVNYWSNSDGTGTKYTLSITSTMYLCYYNPSKADKKPFCISTTTTPQQGYGWISATDFWACFNMAGATIKYYNEASSSSGGTTTAVQGNTTIKTVSSVFSRSGYSANGWKINGTSTTISNTATSYNFNNSPATYNGSTPTIQLNAQWIKNVESKSNFIVYYNANGGSMNPSSETFSCYADDYVTITMNKPTLNGYKFGGWSDPQGGTYAAGGIVARNGRSSVTLSAQWKEDTSSGSSGGGFDLQLKVAKFDENGGVGATLPVLTSILTIGLITIPFESDRLIPGSQVPTRHGYTFIGWSGLGDIYYPGGIAYLEQDTTFYAQWEYAKELTTSNSISIKPQFVGQWIWAVFYPPKTGEYEFFTTSKAGSTGNKAFQFVFSNKAQRVLFDTGEIKSKALSKTLTLTEGEPCYICAKNSKSISTSLKVKYIPRNYQITLNMNNNETYYKGTSTNTVYSGTHTQKYTSLHNEIIISSAVDTIGINVPNSVSNVQPGNYISLPKRLGYDFEEWRNPQGIIPSFNSSSYSSYAQYSFLYNPEKDLTFTPVWKGRNFYIKYEPNGGYFISHGDYHDYEGGMSDEPYTVGNNQSLSINQYLNDIKIQCDSDGGELISQSNSNNNIIANTLLYEVEYQFLGWGINPISNTYVSYSDEVVDSRDVKTYEVISVYAQWNTPTDGIKFQLPQLQKPGYILNSWKNKSTNRTIGNPGDIVSFTQSINLIPEWTPINYSIHFDTGNYTNFNGMSFDIQLKYDDITTLPKNKSLKWNTITYDPSGGNMTNLKEDVYYVFDGWNVENEDLINTNGTYLPPFKDGQQISKLTTIDGTALQFVHRWKDNPTTLPTPKKIGYKFLGWYTEDEEFVGNGGDKYMPTSNISVYAKWEPLGLVRVYVEDGWKLAIPYMYDGDNWKQSMVYIYDDNEWKFTI